jgi:hypothetical protein
MVRGDAMRLRQVLNNLVSNALKFTDTGSITLRLRSWTEEPSGYAILIEVEDTGPGMTAAQLLRLFTPFDQTAEGVSARHGGTGLGLAISRDLVGLMGGRLTARSLPGEGACFTLSLTLAPAINPEAVVRVLDADSRADVARVLRPAEIARAERRRARMLSEPVAEPASAAEALLASLLSGMAPGLAPSVETAPVGATSVEAPVEDAGLPRRCSRRDPGRRGRRPSAAGAGRRRPRHQPPRGRADPRSRWAATSPPPPTAWPPCASASRRVRRHLHGCADARAGRARDHPPLRAGDGPNATTPVIAVTADTAPDDIAACMAAGMDLFRLQAPDPAGCCSAPCSRC